MAMFSSVLTPSLRPPLRGALSRLRPQVRLALALGLLVLSVVALVLLTQPLVTSWSDGLVLLTWVLLGVEIYAAKAVIDAWRRLHPVGRSTTTARMAGTDRAQAAR